MSTERLFIFLIRTFEEKESVHFIRADETKWKVTIKIGGFKVLFQRVHLSMSHVQPRDCCSGFSLMDFTKVSVPDMAVDFTDINLWISVSTILFNPLYWNVLARWEYKSHGLSRIFKSKKYACWTLAASIFLLGIFRDIRFNKAMDAQPRWYSLQQNWILWSGYLCMLTGTIFVLTSYFALGFYGTFLGDYFGFLMDHRVTKFPFNILENPMYWGSTLNFLGGALLKASQTGILLSCLIAVVYKIAILYEGPFTTNIYAEEGKKKVLNKTA